MYNIRLLRHTLDVLLLLLYIIMYTRVPTHHNMYDYYYIGIYTLSVYKIYYIDRFKYDSQSRVRGRRTAERPKQII